MVHITTRIFLICCCVAGIVSGQGGWRPIDHNTRRVISASIFAANTIGAEFENTIFPAHEQVVELNAYLYTVNFNAIFPGEVGRQWCRAIVEWVFTRRGIYNHVRRIECPPPWGFI